MRTLAAFLLALPAAAQEAAPELIVRVGNSRRAQLEAALAREGARVLEEVPQLELLLVSLAPSADPVAARARIATRPGVRYAVPNGRGSGGGGSMPNDTFFASQWPLENLGQLGGRAGADVDARSGWELARGSPSVVVAVLDSGLAAAHPEFTGRVLPGHDFVNEDPDPADDHGHGTFVSGILAANADNAFGLAGVDHGCSLLPVKVLNRFNGGTVQDLVQGLVFAADAGADVVSMSLINYPLVAPLVDALEYARDAGCVLVCCAGNGGLGDADRSGPGRSPLVISVGATTQLDERAWFSGTGRALDLVAPGDLVPATVMAPVDGWDFFGGCSAATPHVAGIAALLLSVDPTRTHEEVKALLEAGADDGVGTPGFDLPGRDDHYGHGRANLFRSLCELDEGGPEIVGPDVLRVESPGPAGLKGGDPAVLAALATLSARDDLDPRPRLQLAPLGDLPLARGVPLELLARDACGHETRRTILVVAEDRGAPAVALALALDRLAPGGALVAIGAASSAADACDARPTIELAVHVDEGAGRGPLDAARDAAGDVLLRAERDPLGDGRVYLLVARARDAAGNTGLAVATVVAPLDGSPAALDSVLAQAAAARAATLAGGAAPAGFRALPLGEPETARR